LSISLYSLNFEQDNCFVFTL